MQLPVQTETGAAWALAAAATVIAAVFAVALVKMTEEAAAAVDGTGH